VSINIDELRRLHEAATPGEWAAFGRELCGPPKPGGRKGLCIFSTRAEDADSELCLYLRNHVPEILAALADRERLTWIIAESNEGNGWLTDDVWDDAGEYCVELDDKTGQSSVRAAIDAARSAK
jgi:hypothetical protein